VFGGGIVPGGVVLLGGDPGIGKSTLALQIASSISGSRKSGSETQDQSARKIGLSTIYVAGEETVEQVAERAARLHGVDPYMYKISTGTSSSSKESRIPDSMYLMSETRVDAIINAMASLKPALIIVDSIQTIMDDQVSGSPGSIVQVRECATRLTQAAKHYRVATVIVGHVTKSGEVAGPRY